jgi:hypothetical protein
MLLANSLAEFCMKATEDEEYGYVLYGRYTQALWVQACAYVASRLSTST